MPLRAIREVLTSDGRPLKRYPLDVKHVSSPEVVYLLTKAMQLVVETGTGRSLNRYLPSQLNLAGKTGTTDDLRDSWFAGFSGNYVGVVWVGNDENQSTGLTGASGALRIWAQTLGSVQVAPLAPAQPEKVKIVNTAVENGARMSRRCANGVELPFIIGYEPQLETSCGGKVERRSDVKGWFDRLLNR